MVNIQFGNYIPRPRFRPARYEVTVSIFFDGTNNNKNNTIARETGASSYQKYGKSNADSSYNNDLTNVARLWNCHTEFENWRRVYVEGIGTEDDKEDDSLGTIFGAGYKGIRYKVRIGCQRLALAIHELCSEYGQEKLVAININVYGFSRGAAAARNFVYDVGKAAYKGKRVDSTDGAMTVFYDADGWPAREEMPPGGHLGYCLLGKNIKIDSNLIKVNFLGLFDTVSAYRTITEPSTKRNTKTLNLNELGKAQQVVHFTAKDEIREHFPLTPTLKGITRGFPGVHSDIGGSYLSKSETVEEIETAIGKKDNLVTLKNKLTREGWYKRKDLSIKNHIVYSALYGHKEMIHKEYSYIPLHFMAEYSSDYKVPIDYALLLRKYSIAQHKILISAKSTLRKYVREGGTYPYEYDNITDQKILYELVNLRYWYFHRSANRKGFGMDPTNDWKRREQKE